MRLSPEDEHVVLYGRPTNNEAENHLVVMTFNGEYKYNEDLDAWTAADAYPSLQIAKLTNFLADKNWRLESIKISHANLFGTMIEFIKLASCLKQCTTLKSVFFCDSTTSLQTRGSEIKLQTGFDSLISALSKTPSLMEVTLQNMIISGEGLLELCRSNSLEKLQIMIAPALLSTGNISGSFIGPMSRCLRKNRTLKELRIVGLLDLSACCHLSEMLHVNKSLEKVSFKVKLKSLRYNNGNPPFLEALRSPFCSIRSLELYLSGSREDLEMYAGALTKALRENRLLKCLDIVFYGMDLEGRGALSESMTKQVWMDNFAKLLETNYALQHIMLNHGLVDLDEKVKFYLKLNRAGRGCLFDWNTSASTVHQKSSDEIVAGRSDNRSEQNSCVRLSEDEMWIRAFGRLQDDIRCIHYMLSRNPSLICRTSSSLDSSLPMKRKR